MTGPTGPEGTVSDDVFASFANTQYTFSSGNLITLYPDVTDPTGNIVSLDTERIALQPGYYLVSYRVSGLFRTPNYMQVTPYYNDVPHLAFGIYFAANANGSSACGSAFLVLYAPAATVFTLTYTGSGDAVEGDVNLTFLKLRRTA